MRISNVIEETRLKAMRGELTNYLGNCELLGFGLVSQDQRHNANNIYQIGEVICSWLFDWYGVHVQMAHTMQSLKVSLKNVYRGCPGERLPGWIEGMFP